MVSEPLSGFGTAVALGGATYLGGCLPGRISDRIWCVRWCVICGNNAADTFSLACGCTFSVSFIVGVLGADVMASYLVETESPQHISRRALRDGIGGVGEDSLIHPPAGYRIAGIRAVLRLR